MPNDSTTGGYLQSAAAPTPLEGKDLLIFLQTWMVGITGLPGNMVRPRWQPESPDIPQAGNVWAALGVTSRPSDVYPFIGHDSLADGGIGRDKLERQEELVILTSFYDTGVTGLADFYAALFRDGTAIAQNREPLELAGMAFVRAGELTTLPSLIKQRWLYQVDLEIVVRRQIDRTYPVRNLVAAQGKVLNDLGAPAAPWVVPAGLIVPP